MATSLSHKSDFETRTSPLPPSIILSVVYGRKQSFFALLSPPPPLSLLAKTKLPKWHRGGQLVGDRRGFFALGFAHNPCFRDKRIGGNRNRQLWRQLLQNKAKRHRVSSLLTALLPVFCPHHKADKSCLRACRFLLLHACEFSPFEFFPSHLFFVFTFLARVPRYPPLFPLLQSIRKVTPHVRARGGGSQSSPPPPPA